MSSRNSIPLFTTKSVHDQASFTLDYDPTSLGLPGVGPNQHVNVYNEWVDDLSIIDGVYYESADQDSFDGVYCI